MRRAAVRSLGAFRRGAIGLPETLASAPRAVRTADPTVAWDIYSGWFSFAGKGVNAHGRSPFELDPPSEAWADELARFEWLRHLQAADTALARANAKALVDDWMAMHPKPDGARDWRLEPTCRRLLSWLVQSPLILQDADAAFHARFMRSLMRHAALIERRLREGVDGKLRLTALIALAQFAQCVAGAEAFKRRSMEQLEREIDAQILADGGHIGRNPQTLVDLLLDLIPLRQQIAARGQDAPSRLFNGVDRMGPMLRLFRHGDGDLALFNGMGPTALDDLGAALAHADLRAQPMLNAPASGYQRIEAGDSLLIMDVGPPPPRAFSQEAHAGALSFELSSGAQRLVVNCGAPAGARSELRRAARATAAHSTLTLGDMSSCRFAVHAGLERWAPGQIVAGPKMMQSRRVEDAQTVAIEALHDGYERMFGLIHRRRIRLFKHGGRLDGRDTLEARSTDTPIVADVSVAIRFHLHPGAEPTPGESPGDVDIRLPDGQIWTFRCEDGAIAIEDSVFFASTHGPRACRQLVIEGRADESRSIAWSFQRLSAAPSR